MSYQIIQKYCWLNIYTGQPRVSVGHNIVVREFKTWLGAYVWKMLNYDLVAEPAWKMSFSWTIVKHKKEGE